MTRDELIAIGTALYGDTWMGVLARDLQIDDRNVQRWALGTREIPDWVEPRLKTLFETFEQSIAKAKAVLDGEKGEKA